MKVGLALLAALMVVPTSAAFLENFDDDTVGANPSGSGYTYAEDGTVAAQGVSNAFNLTSPNSFVLNEAGHAVDFQSSQDFCIDGWGMEWDFYFDTTLPSAGVIGMGVQTQSVFTVPGATNGQVGRSDAENLAVLLLVTAGTGDFDLFYRDGTFSETLEIPSFGAATVGSWYHAEIVIDNCDGVNGGAFDYTLTLENGHLGSPVSQARTQNVANVGDFTLDYFVAGDQSGTGDTGDKLYLDNLCLSFYCDGSSPQVPTAPSGLAAIVKVAGASAQVGLRWPVSSNDPNQTVGAFDYEIIVDGIQLDVDVVGVTDGNGFREYILNLGGTSTSNFIQVRARNATSLLASPLSCTVEVNIQVLSDNDVCGSGVTLGSLGQPGGFPGVDLDQFATDTGISLTAAGWILGLFLTVGLAGGLYAALGQSVVGGALGGFLGIGVGTAFGLFPVWFVVFLVLCAVTLLVLRARNGA